MFKKIIYTHYIYNDADEKQNNNCDISKMIKAKSYSKISPNKIFFSYRNQQTNLQHK